MPVPSLEVMKNSYSMPNQGSCSAASSMILLHKDLKLNLAGMCSEVYASQRTRIALQSFLRGSLVNKMGFMKISEF